MTNAAVASLRWYQKDRVVKTVCVSLALLFMFCIACSLIAQAEHGESAAKSLRGIRRYYVRYNDGLHGKKYAESYETSSSSVSGAAHEISKAAVAGAIAIATGDTDLLERVIGADEWVVSQGAEAEHGAGEQPADQYQHS